MEELDTVSASLDALPESLDSRRWTEGAIQISAFNTSHKQATFSGTTLAATLETGEQQLFPGRRAYVSAVRPLVDGSGAVATVAAVTRKLQSETDVVGSAVATHSETNLAPVRSDARYHRFRVVTSGAYDFAVGLDVYAKPSGQR